MTSDNGVPEPHPIDDAVWKINGLLDHGGSLTQGDIALLRRMDPRAPAAPFFKIEGLVLEPLLPGDADTRMELETRWAAIVAGLVLLNGLHSPGVRLGKALAQADFSELRFVRLCRADAARLVEDLLMVARFLAAKGIAADWTAAAWLMLSAGRIDEERVRRNLARDYYGALAHQDDVSKTNHS